MARLFASNAIYAVEATNDRKGYKAGKLSQLGLETIADAYRPLLLDWFANNYDLDKASGQYRLNSPVHLAERRAVNSLFYDKISTIMAADTEKERTIDNWLDAYENDSGFFEQCYRAAILQNPNIDKEQYAIYQAEIERQQLEQEQQNGYSSKSFLETNTANGAPVS